ncbi:Biotin synthase [invertebrate metagenome]|uniref:biotin synthase n=1 Tax=invertebrate metagenome TaxID=1711999 RepID=A0A484H6X8_9ZZZZ
MARMISSGDTTAMPNHQLRIQEEAVALFALPFNDLLHQAHETYRRHWDVNTVQLSTLLSIKSGGCGENCKYCSQSSHYHTSIEVTQLMEPTEVRTAARKAKAAGASRLCMGAAWRALQDRHLGRVADMITSVKEEGLESCVTLGLLTAAQATLLKEAGLDYYNHNIDTSEEYYSKVVSTRTFNDRLNSLRNAHAAGLKVCSGGIIGMGESRIDRAIMLATLANLQPPPESVPINMLVPITGTPLAASEKLNPLELVRTIAVTRLLIPGAWVRLSAGRTSLSDEAQALCFFAGANSIFYGDRLLTTDNPVVRADQMLLAELGLRPGAVEGKTSYLHHDNSTVTEEREETI